MTIHMYDLDLYSDLFKGKNCVYIKKKQHWCVLMLLLRKLQVGMLMVLYMYVAVPFLVTHALLCWDACLQRFWPLAGSVTQCFHNNEIFIFQNHLFCTYTLYCHDRPTQYTQLTLLQCPHTMPSVQICGLYRLRKPRYRYVSLETQRKATLSELPTLVSNQDTAVGA